METNEMNQNLNPGNWIMYIFSAEVWLFFASYLGIFEGDNYLVLGIILLASYPMYIFSGNLYHKTNNAFMANFCYIFGTLFGGFCGGGYIAYYIGHVTGVTMDERIFGILYFVGFFYMLVTIPTLLYLDKVNLFTWLLCTIWFVAGGLLYFYVLPTIMYMINVVCCGLVGVGATYMMMSEVSVMCGGKPYPMGKPFRTW